MSASPASNFESASKACELWLDSQHWTICTNTMTVPDQHLKNMDFQICKTIRIARILVTIKLVTIKEINKIRRIRNFCRSGEVTLANLRSIKVGSTGILMIRNFGKLQPQHFIFNHIGLYAYIIYISSHMHTLFTNQSSF